MSWGVLGCPGVIRLTGFQNEESVDRHFAPTKNFADYSFDLISPDTEFKDLYSCTLDKGLSTRKPIEWQRLTSHVEVQIRDYLSTGKYYIPTIIKSQVHNP